MLRVIIVSVFLLVPATLMAFKPFTDVVDVCSTCPAPKADVLTINDGNRIRGTIIGENTAFYVMLRHHEVRAIPKNQVQAVEYAQGSKPVHVGTQDQVVLKNGHVLNGEIVEDKDKPAHFQVKSSQGDMTLVAFKSEVSKVYKDGLEVSF